MLHSPAHGVGAGEQARRGFAIARLKGFADAARGDHFLGVIDGRDHFGEEAEAARMVGEGDDIAAATLAENEIGAGDDARGAIARSEEHTSELQSLMRLSYAVFCLKNKNTQSKHSTRKIIRLYSTHLRTHNWS